MHGPERPRHPHGPLQLHVHVVFVSIRRKAEDHAREQRGGGAAGEIPREREHPETRHDDRAQQQQVVHEHGRKPRPNQRRRHEPLDDHRVGIRERARLGIEDVRVEEMTRVRRDGVRHPCEPPHVEVDVLVRDRRVANPACLRPRHEDGERGEEQRRPHPAAQRHSASIPISRISRSALRDVASPSRSR